MFACADMAQLDERFRGREASQVFCEAHLSGKIEKPCCFSMVITSTFVVNLAKVKKQPSQG